MERNVNGKSRKIKWRGFIAKVLVFALVLTSVPIYQGEKQVTVAAATDPTLPQGAAVGIADATTFVNYINMYIEDAAADIQQFPDGLVLQLEKDLDFAEAEAIPMIPEGKIWILMNGYNMLNVPMRMFDVGSKEGVMPETGEYAYYLNFDGGGSIHWNNYEDEMQTVEAVTELVVDAGAKVVVSGVDFGTTNFVVRNGADLAVEGIDYSNPLNSNYIQYHCANEATYRLYEYVPIINMDNEMLDPVSIIHYQKLSENLFTTEEGVATECAVLNMIPSGKENYLIGRYIYDTGALPSCITQLNFDGYLYDVPAESFIVDSDYGIYSLADDGRTMTFYGCEVGTTADINTTSITEGEGETAVTKDIAVMNINRNFTPYVLVELENYGLTGTMVQATKVIFKEGSIPAQYQVHNWTTDVTEYYDVTKILLHSMELGAELPGCIDFTFEIEENRNIEVFNRSNSVVTVPDYVTLWVSFPVIEGDYASDYYLEYPGKYGEDGKTTNTGDLYLTADVSNLVKGYDGIDSYYYAQAGSYVILTPAEGYTIHDIELGGWTYNSDMMEYNYTNGKRAYEYITHYTNGSKKLTVPNFACDYAAAIDEMNTSTIENNQDYPSLEYKFSADRIYGDSYTNPENSSEVIYEDWYDQDVTISGNQDTEVSTETYYHNYLICDESEYDSTETNVEWTSEGITITEEGTAVTKIFKMINLSEKETYDSYDEDFDGDTTDMIRIPVEGYGSESWVKYTYTLDKTSPMITAVTATDADGKVLNLNGGWYDGEGVKPEAATVWSTVSPVSVEILAEDKVTGVSEYLFGGVESAVWEGSTKTEFKAEGEYSFALQARDQMESYAGKTPKGQWITAFGIDTVAPVVHYTDAVTAQGTEIKSDGVYQGNLYLELIEDTSGINQIQLYKDVAGAWVENTGALVKVTPAEATGYERYYITPADVDEVYRIVVSDVAGNETVYDNLTLAGYEQDIQVTLGTTEAKYGEQWMLPVTIENISADSLQINQIVLREGASDTVFELSGVDVSELAIGAAVEFSVSIPAGVDAGEYEAVLDITYTNTNDNIYVAMDKAYSEPITATIEKAEGAATFEIEDFYFGETINPVCESKTNGNEGVTILYKDKNDLSAQYTESVPTEVGSYQAKAEFPGNTNYEPVTMETTFNITRLVASEDMYMITEAPMETGWYTTDVTIMATGDNQIAIAENGVFSPNLTIKESVESYTFYIKTATGAITEAVTLSDIKIDKTAPEVGENEGIYAVKTWWQTFLETITFGIYQTETETIQITAHDEESGIKAISYYISDSEMTLEEVQSLVEWTVGNSLVMNIETERDYVVYAKLENNAGLISYLSSDGIMVRNEDIQYITLAAEEVTGVYGTDIIVPVTINNTAEKVITINSIALNKDSTAEEFVLGELANREIPAQGKAEVILTLPAETPAGSYAAELVISYSLQGSNESTRIEKTYSERVTATVEQAEGMADVAVADIYYGETLKPVVESATNGAENVQLMYKVADDASAEYGEVVPTAVGNYYVKAVFPATANYKEVVVEKTFAIKRLEATAEMYTITEADGKDGWYTGNVTITATTGNQLAVTEEGSYVSGLVIEESVESYTFYVKTATGAITDAIVLSDIKIDKTAPEVGENEGIYAVKTWWQTFLEVITFGIYQTEEETIQISAHDEESGIKNISYYVSDDAMTLEEVQALEAWTEGTEFTIDIAVERDYVVYARLENNAGLVSYLSSDGIMVRNEKIQYITVVATGMNGTYGKETTVKVTINNTSEKPITINSLALSEETSSAEFVLGELENKEIPAMGNVAVILTLPAGTDAGSYVAVLEFAYSLQGSNESTRIEKTYSEAFTATVEAAEGTGTVTVEDIYYGEILSPVAESVTNGAEKVEFMYKSATDTQAQYTSEVPKAVGNYYIKATFPETTNYKEVVVEKAFAIKRLEATAEMYTITEADGKDGWYTGDVVITAATGYQLAMAEDGAYVSSLTIKESADSYSFYIKTATGAITDAVVLGNIKIDHTAPEVGENEGIYAVKTWWQTFLEVITFGIYQTEAETIQISAHDEESGIKNISYYVSDDAMTLEEVQALEAWTEGTEFTIDIAVERDYVVYARLENNAGLVSYLSSDGIMVRNEKIQYITVVATGMNGTYGKETTVKVTINNTSEKPITINSLALSEETSSAEFVLGELENKEIPAMGNVAVILTLPAGTDAGSYVAVLEFAYSLQGSNESTRIEKTYSEAFTATVEAAEGTGTVTVEDIYYGEILSPVAESVTNGAEKVEFMYKSATDTQAQYTSEVPKAVGNYYIKATFPETTNYKEVVVEKTFAIKRLEATAEMYTVTEADGKDGWYTGDVVITAATGYQLATAEDGAYASSLTIKESVDSYSFYIKTATGAITDAVVLENIKIDRTAPEVGENEGIYAVKTWWQTFLEVITFGIYQTEEETIQISAHDEESGIKNISYYVSNVAMTMEDVKALETWTVGTEFVMDVDTPGNYVIYARIENNAGLVTYLSTDGIVIESTEEDTEVPGDIEIPVEPDVPAGPIDGIVSTEGTVHLEAGTAYKLSEGNWSVSGDDTVYTGGITFYVLEDGDYDFKVVE